MTSAIPPTEQISELPGDETATIPATPTTAPISDPAAAPQAPVQGIGAEILGAITALWVSLGSVWKGKSVEAFRLGASTKKFWVVGFLSYSLILGLLTATLVARSVDSADEMLGSMTSSFIGYSTRGTFGLSVGNWISLFITGLILALIAFVLRALCLKWTFSIRGVRQSMGVVGNVITTSYVMQMTVLLAATVLLMIPSAVISGLVLLLVGLVSVPLVLISEVLIYIGINRTARFEKSSLIPHAVFTGVWIALTLTVYAIILTVTLENMF